MNAIKAMEISEACKDGMTDFDVMMLGAELFRSAGIQPTEEVLNLMFKYSGTLAAAVATRVTHILMSESDLSSMIKDIEEFENLEREVFGE